MLHVPSHQRLRVRVDTQPRLQWRDTVQRPSTKNVIFYSDSGLMVSEHCIQHEKTISSKLDKICTF